MSASHDHARGSQMFLHVSAVASMGDAKVTFLAIAAESKQLELGEALLVREPKDKTIKESFSPKATPSP